MDGWNQAMLRDRYAFAQLLFAMLTGIHGNVHIVPKLPRARQEWMSSFASKVKTPKQVARRDRVRMLSLSPGTRLGPYAVVSEIGRGGQGKVFLVRDTRRDSLVALKAYPAGRRPIHEAQVLSLLRHPHICTLLDVGQEHDIAYLVLEYLDGQTVAERLRAGPIPAVEALEYAQQIANALQAMHGQGIAYREMSPSNTMLTESGVKLIDFGKARRFANTTNS